MTGLSRRAFLRVGVGGMAVGTAGVAGLAATGRLGDGPYELLARPGLGTGAIDALDPF